MQIVVLMPYAVMWTAFLKGISRIYGLSFGGYNVRFKVEDGILNVVGIE